MNNRRENQITLRLHEMKKQKWQVTLLVCLSVLVIAGVAGIFHLPAISKTYQVRELTCTAVPPRGALYSPSRGGSGSFRRCRTAKKYGQAA